MGPVGPNPDRQERSYESYDLPEDVQRPDLNLDIRHRDRDLRPVMDGQTLVLTDPGSVGAEPVRIC